MFFKKRVFFFIKNIAENKEVLRKSGKLDYLEWILDAEDIRSLKKLKFVREYRMKTKIYIMGLPKKVRD